MRMSLQAEQRFDSTPDLIKKIRQLLVSLEPHIRDAGTFQQAEETLRHLEEYEDNFHKFGFVKQLKKHVDCVLGPLIDDEIEKHSAEIQVNTITKQGGQTLVEKITDNIIRSKLHTEFNRRLKTNLTEALDQLQKNFNAEFVVSKQTNPDCFLSSNKPDDFSDEDGSYATSFNQGSLVFICHEKLLDLCSSLAKGRDYTSRCEALRMLNQVPIAAEILCGDHWPMMRKHLFDAFSDTDPRLTNLSLKFISHAFSTVNPQTKEIYSLLVDNLIHQLQTLEKNNDLLLENGLCTSSPAIDKIIKMFRLMNDFQHEIPNYWVRFPEKFMKKILESTLKLVSNVNETTTPSGQALLHPVHFLALLDCRASWFSKWMHGIYSRAPLLKLLKKHESLVNNSVRCVLEYIKKIKEKKVDTVNKRFFEKVPSEYSHDLRYSGGQLNYAFVVHSINLLGRLLMFKSGRKMFPVHMLDTLVAVSIPQLLISLCTLIVRSASTPDGHYYCDNLNPSILATEVLNNLCSKEDACSICLCKDMVTDIVMIPITRWLDSYKKNGQPPAMNERILLQVIGILCRMASTSSGRKHLLYGEDKDLLSRSLNSTAHTLVEFCSCCLKKMTSGMNSEWPSRKVITEMLYLCRLLSSTCEGFYVLQDYKLHIVLMQAWKRACLESENTATPVPTDTDSDDSCSLESVDSNWELILQDSLLSMASCAKGIQLLEQMGLLYPCAAYMNSRMAKELQVSKYEKFGYGFMISVFAATAAGVQALQTTDYVRYQLVDTWSILECPISDTPPIRQKCWPTEVIDRSCQKQLVRLSTLLYAFPAVYELLANEPLANKDTYSFREVPQTMVDFLDRLIILNNPAKIHSLFNYEESHGFGLRVLSGLVCSLDACLLLETQYHFQELFLEAQDDAALTDGDDSSIMIDMLSVERNHILVRSYVIGGPTERILPTRVLREDCEDPYPFPFFSKFPVPAFYSPTLPKWKHPNQDNDQLQRLFTMRAPKESGRCSVWLTELRALVSDVLCTHPAQLQGTVVQHLLEEVTSACLETDFTYPPAADPEAVFDQSTPLSPLQVMGSKMVLRYGERLGLLSKEVDHFDELGQLLQLTSAHLLQPPQHAREKEPLDKDQRPKFPMEYYPGFDWFSATIFLIYNGNKDKAWRLLSKLSCLPISTFIWPACLPSLISHLPKQKLITTPLLYSTTAYLVDLLLQIELPLVASAFRMSGFSAAQICQQWLLQAFWNYLDWPDIVHYICVCCVLGLDYQVYVCMAILRYLHTDIALHTQQHDLNIFLKEEALNGFHVGEHLAYMKELQKNYRDIILPEMQAIT